MGSSQHRCMFHGHSRLLKIEDAIPQTYLTSFAPTQPPGHRTLPRTLLSTLGKPNSTVYSSTASSWYCTPDLPMNAHSSPGSARPAPLQGGWRLVITPVVPSLFLRRLTRPTWMSSPHGLSISPEGKSHLAKEKSRKLFPQPARQASPHSLANREDHLILARHQHPISTDRCDAAIGQQSK